MRQRIFRPSPEPGSGQIILQCLIDAIKLMIYPVFCPYTASPNVFTKFNLLLRYTYAEQESPYFKQACRSLRTIQFIIRVFLHSLKKRQDHKPFPKLCMVLFHICIHEACRLQTLIYPCSELFAGITSCTIKNDRCHNHPPILLFNCLMFFRAWILNLWFSSRS